MTDTSTLKIDLNKGYKIKIEKSEELSESIFANVYKKAAKNTIDILRQSEANVKLESDEYQYINEEQEYNNIITFVGGRGTGKSSAMLTFSQNLFAPTDDKKLEEFYGSELYGHFKNKSFKSIGTIDPSLFETEENIFEVIIAQLFLNFEEHLNENSTNQEGAQKRKVLELFEKVYSNLQTIKKNGEKYNGEALETLSKLACGVNLRRNFKDLVKEYLAFLTNKQNEAFLVIPIDDFDLNIQAVAEMAEQIRKYLMIPRVIILMAANIEQLADAKEQSIRKDLDIMIKANVIFENPKDLAQQYLTKLIPHDKRVILPLLLNNSKYNKVEVWADKKLIKEYSTMEDCILELINEKTELFLLKPKTETHFFVPLTLRDYTDLFYFLYNLNSDIIKENQLLFQEYLTHTWTKRNISKEYHDKIGQLFASDYRSRNKTLVNIIASLDIATHLRKKGEKHIDQILDLENNSLNVSYGDVLYIFDRLQPFINNEEKKILINFFKIAYNLLLLIDYKQDEKTINTLIGGNVFTPYQLNFIGSGKDKMKIDYDKRTETNNIKINGTTIKQVISEVKGPDDINNDVKLIEWLHYFIWGFDHDQKYSNYKSSKEIYYQKSTRLGENVGRHGVADFFLMSLFASITNPLNVWEKIFKISLNKARLGKLEQAKIYNASLSGEIHKWINCKEVKNIIPLFYNLEVISRILEEYNNDHKDNTDRAYTGYIKYAFEQIKRILNNITSNQNCLHYDTDIMTTNPVIKRLYKTNDDIGLINFVNTTLTLAATSNTKTYQDVLNDIILKITKEGNKSTIRATKRFITSNIINKINPYLNEDREFILQINKLTSNVLKELQEGESYSPKEIFSGIIENLTDKIDEIKESLVDSVNTNEVEASEKEKEEAPKA